MIQRALKMLRVYHHISQKDLAEKLSISNSFLSELEHGKKSPTLDLLGKYSDLFNIPVSSILMFSESIDNNDGNSKRKVVVNYFADKVLKILEWMTECSEIEKKEKLSN